MGLCNNGEMGGGAKARAVGAVIGGGRPIIIYHGEGKEIGGFL